MMQVKKLNYYGDLPFIMNLVRYQRLHEIIGEDFKNSDAIKVHVIIDLYPIYRYILKNRQIFEFRDDDFITGLLLMVSHYKSFFKSIEVDAKFTFVSSFNCPELNRKLCYRYNESMYQLLSSSKEDNKCMNFLNNGINKSLDLFSNLHIKFIHTSYESGVGILHAMNSDHTFTEFLNAPSHKCPAIIISKDIMYLTQIISNNMSIIRPRKSQGDDTSYSVINTTTSISRMIKRTRNLSLDYDITPVDIKHILLLGSVPERNLRGEYQIPTIVKKRDEITNDIGYNISRQQPQKGRMEAVDLLYQYMVYSSSPEYKINESRLEQTKFIDTLPLVEFINNSRSETKIDINSL